MDKGDVEMVDAEENVPARDVLVSNDSPSDSKGEDSKNARSETEDQLNSKSQPEAHDNVVLENKTPIIDAGTDDTVSGYLNVTDDEVQKINKREVNQVDHSEKMIYEVNQNGNDLMVATQDDPQMKRNATTVTIDGGTRSDEFPKHNGEASKNQADGEDNEGFFEDQPAFIGKLGTFYREKAMEFKQPRSCHVLPSRLWRSMIRLGGYDWNWREY
ncbi:hypothetical protein KY285_012273 [Solanum tuberosum]|nr:hypothetical protein KY285_012273 [Solanum tuberosum]